MEKTPNFVWLMRNALKNVERSLVVTVIHRTTDKKCAEAFVKSEGIKVLHEWCAKAKEENKSSLVLKMLKTFRRLPMTVEVLSSTGLGNFVNKLRKYKPPGKEDDDLTNQVVQEAEHREKQVGLHRASRVGGCGEAAGCRRRRRLRREAPERRRAHRRQRRIEATKGGGLPGVPGSPRQSKEPRRRNPRRLA